MNQSAAASAIAEALNISQSRLVVDYTLQLTVALEAARQGAGIGAGGRE